MGNGEGPGRGGDGMGNQWELQNFHIWKVSGAAINCNFVAVLTSICQTACQFWVFESGERRGGYGGYKTKRDLSLPPVWPH